VVLSTVLAILAFLSLALTLWQFIVALRFPLHQRAAGRSFTPPITLLKPLKGCDPETFHCFESWLTQDYAGPMQILFGVSSADDPVCEIVRQLIAGHPERDAQLMICSESFGANAKVSTLIQLLRRTKHDVIIVSDADVRVPPDFLVNVVAPLRDPAVGLVNCFYRLTNPGTLAMQWEAIAINADFWSQVMQSQSLKPLDFALGAVMATTRSRIDGIGGFRALVDFLADDYYLGNMIAKKGGRIVLSPVVVECWESPKNWSEVWRHQLRWARTIRVCQPLPYFFSLLGNATLWPLLWWNAQLASAGVNFTGSWQGTTGYMTGVSRLPVCTWIVATCLLARILTAIKNQQKLTQSLAHAPYFWLTPVKDLLNALIWALAFLGSTVEWRGRRYRVRRNGELVSVS
jgi:ceramide glucosyltransferase